VAHLLSARVANRPGLAVYFVAFCLNHNSVTPINVRAYWHKTAPTGAAQIFVCADFGSRILLELADGTDYRFAGQLVAIVVVNA
jgi:hypothetical protein